MTSEADALRFVYEPHAAKKIARDFGVAIVTAKLWLAGRFPVTRRAELAARIQARLDERDAMSAEIRRHWSGGNSEATRAVDRRRLIAPSTQAHRLGRRGEEAMTPPS